MKKAMCLGVVLGVMLVAGGARGSYYNADVRACLPTSKIGGTGSGGTCSDWFAYTADSYDTYTFSQNCAGNRVDGVAVWSSYGYHQTTAPCGFDGFTVDSSNFAQNRYCWCRLTYPVMTGWMVVKDDSSGAGHEGGCATECKAFLPNGGSINIAKTAGICDSTMRW